MCALGLTRPDCYGEFSEHSSVQGHLTYVFQFYAYRGKTLHFIEDSKFIPDIIFLNLVHILQSSKRSSSFNWTYLPNYTVFGVSEYISLGRSENVMIQQ
jgi:hypothetical protein